MQALRVGSSSLLSRCLGVNVSQAARGLVQVCRAELTRALFSTSSHVERCAELYVRSAKLCIQSAELCLYSEH